MDISRAIEKIFIWAYRLRLEHQAVYLASIDNYVIQRSNIFKIIKDAVFPHEVTAIHIPVMTQKASSTNTEELENLFRKLNYYDFSNAK